MDVSFLRAVPHHLHLVGSQAAASGSTPTALRTVSTTRRALELLAAGVVIRVAGQIRAVCRSVPRLGALRGALSRLLSFPVSSNSNTRLTILAFHVLDYIGDRQRDSSRLHSTLPFHSADFDTPTRLALRSAVLGCVKFSWVTLMVARTPVLTGFTGFIPCVEVFPRTRGSERMSFLLFCFE